MKFTDNFLKRCLDPLSSYQISVKFSVMRRNYSLLHGPYQGRGEFDSLRLSEDELNADLQYFWGGFQKVRPHI